MAGRSARGWLYWLARREGDLEAVERGPSAVARREGRKIVYRKVNRSTARWLRRLGL
jgi:hypothetical protein